MTRHRTIWILWLAVFALACTRAKPEPSAPATPIAAPVAATAPSPTTPPASAPTGAPPLATPETRVCELVAKGNLTAYQRPSIDAEVFAIVQPGMRLYVEAVTADGWIGFEPGSAQAGNVGIFRLRWLRDGGAFSLEGTCDDLPLGVGPPARVCFTMCMLDTPVYAQADLSSPIIVTMHHEDYARVLGAAEGWLYVDLGVGSLGLDQRGWIRSETASFNGPCEDLPTLTP